MGFLICRRLVLNGFRNLSWPAFVNGEPEAGEEALNVGGI
jgi:hypothetical protein